MKLEILFLKIAVCMLAIPVLAFCIFVLPWVANELEHYPAYLLYPFLVDMYATALPFFVALYQTLRFLSYIDKNKAFSKLSIRALKNIRYCATAIGIMFGLAIPFLYLVAEKDDAPGILAVGLAITFASIVIAVFANVLKKLFQNAVEMKSV